VYLRTDSPTALVRNVVALVLFGALCSVVPSVVAAQPSNPGPGSRRGPAIEALIESTGPEALQSFAEEHLAPTYRRSFAPAALTAHLERIRTACAGFGGVTAQRAEGGGTRLTFMKPTGTVSVVFQTQDAPPYQIVSLVLEAGESAPPGVQVAPISWDQLEQRLDEEGKAGLSGTVLAVRGGKVEATWAVAARGEVR